MNKRVSVMLGDTGDISSLEADLAFFEARLSLAAEAPDSVYQRAQIKTYRALGVVIGETVSALRARKTKRVSRVRS